MLEHDAHVLAHAELFAADLVVLHQVGAFEDVAPSHLQLVHADIGKARLQTLLDEHLGLQKIATVLWDHIQLHRSHFHLLVFEQTAHQLGPRVFGLFALGHFFRGQQHARLDLDEHGRHEQVFGGQLQVALTDFIHITQVLACHARHGDVENVEVLLADQVQQQVQRAFKSLQKHLQRIRRDVQVYGHGEQGLAIQTRQGHLVDHRRHGRIERIFGQLQGWDGVVAHGAVGPKKRSARGGADSKWLRPWFGTRRVSAPLGLV